MNSTRTHRLRCSLCIGYSVDAVDSWPTLPACTTLSKVTLFEWSWHNPTQLQLQLSFPVTPASTDSNAKSSLPCEWLCILEIHAMVVAFECFRQGHARHHDVHEICYSTLQDADKGATMLPDSKCQVHQQLLRRGAASSNQQQELQQHLCP